MKNKIAKFYDKPLIYLLVTLVVIFVIYAFSLNRPWQPFDERILFDETFLPIPRTFGEILEIVNAFGLNYHLESMNTFFSNNLTIRTNPLDGVFNILTLYFFKTNALFYHLFQVTLHLINTTLVWLIFYNIVKIISGSRNNLLGKSSYFLVSLFALFWGIHSACSEAILLTTNNNIVLSYTLCFSFILFEVRRFSIGNFKVSFFRIIIISVLFLATMLLVEYGYPFPLTIFFLLLALSYKQNPSISKSVKQALKLSLPYFLGFTTYVLISLTREHSPLENLTHSFSTSGDYSPIYAFIERNLWLTPQIFVHFLTLILFPVDLSTYQSTLTKITETLINPYSLFSTITYLAFLTFPIIFFFVFKNKKFSFIFFLPYTFYFALFPFLHIIVPAYSLSADRYCYFPTFFISLIALVVIFISNFHNARLKTVFIPLLCIVFLVLIRTVMRINDWKNPEALYKSAMKLEKDPLYKGQKLIIYGDYIGTLGKHDQMKSAYQESLEEFEKSLRNYTKRKEQIINQPLTLKLYGLDLDSLILKAVYGIATIKNDKYLEDPNTVLAFYEPYIKKNFNNAFPNQIALYASILAKVDRLDDAKTVLEKGLKRYPYCSSLIFSLVNYHLMKNNLDDAYKYLKLANDYFPNNILTVYKFAEYYEAKQDLENLAKYAYLTGLRSHSQDGYLKAARLYLKLNKPSLAKKSAQKLANLKRGQ